MIKKDLNNDFNILKKFNIVSEDSSPAISLYNVIKNLTYNYEIDNLNFYINEVEKLPDNFKQEFYNLFFGDLFLSSIVLKKSKSNNKLFSITNLILNNKYSSDYLIKNIHKIDYYILPISINHLFYEDKVKISEKLLTRIAERKDSKKEFTKYAISSLLILKGEVDRGLRLYFDNLSTPFGNLLLLYSYIKYENNYFIELMIEEECRTGNNLTSELLKIISNLILNNKELTVTESIFSLIKKIPLSEKFDKMIDELLEKNIFENIIKKSDIASSAKLDGLSSYYLKTLINTIGKNLEALLKLSEIHERNLDYLQAIKILNFIEKEVPEELEIKRRIVENFTNLGNYRIALNKLEEIIKIEPDDFITLKNGLSLCLELKEVEKSIEFSEKILKIDENDIDALRIIAQNLPDNKSEEIWLKILQIDATDKEAQLEIQRIKLDENNRQFSYLLEEADKYSEAGDIHRAEQKLNEIIDLNPSYIEAYLKLYSLLKKSGDMIRAFFTLKQGINADSTRRYPNLRIMAGKLGVKLRKLKESCEILEDVKRDAANDLDSRILLVECKRELAFRGELDNSFTEEMDKIEEEIENNSDDVLLKFEKGYLLQFMPKFYRGENRENGIALLDNVRRSFPENEKIWEIVLLSLIKEDRLADGLKLTSIMREKSLNTTKCDELILKYGIEVEDENYEDYFKQLIDISPNNILMNDYFKYKTNLLKESDDISRISEYIRNCKKRVNEKDYISLFQLAYAYNTLYNVAKMFGEPFSLAMGIFKQILSIDEKFLPAYGGIKETAIRASHEYPELLDDAERYLQKGVDLFPDSPFIYRQYGELLDKGFGKNRNREAMEMYEKSLTLDFYSPRIHLALAGISRLLGDERKSTYHYMMVTELAWNKTIKEESIRALNYLRRSKNI